MPLLYSSTISVIKLKSYPKIQKLIRGKYKGWLDILDDDTVSPTMIRTPV